MRGYRAYILGIDGHRFVWAKEFLSDHPNDSAAVDTAKRLADKHDVEVWEGSRLVARLSPARGELAPTLAPDCGQSSVRPVEPIELRVISELVLAAYSNDGPFGSFADEVIDLPRFLPHEK